jgi:hypothetical protein
MDKDRRRAERRRRTAVYRARQWALHRTYNHGGWFGCRCERTTCPYRKRGAVGCNHRAKQKGAPKLPASLCRWENGGYRLPVQERIAGKRIARAWLAAADPDDPPRPA